MKKKGFTLVELLAVIIILAVIALIATPIVLKVVDSAKKSAFESSVYGIIDTIELEVANKLLDGENLEREYNFPTDELEVNGNQPTGGKAAVDEKGKIAIAVHNGEWCAIKGYNAGTLTIIEYDEDTCVSAEQKVVIAECYEIENSESCRTCYEYEEIKAISGFSINYDTCYETFMDGSGISEEEVVSVCSGGADSTGMTLESMLNDYPEAVEMYEQMGIIEDVEYSQGENVKLTKFNCYEGNSYGLPTITDIVIPTKIDDKYVTSLDSQLFYQMKITSVDFSASHKLTTIGFLTFAENQISGKLDLSHNTNLETILYSAFADNQISSVKLPSSIEVIMEDTFNGNEISGELDLSEYPNLKTIELCAFCYNDITSVKLPSSVTEIGQHAFNKNSTSNPNLTTIINPSGNVFDWSSITGSETTGQSFVTGTITHQNGDITVTAE